MEIQHSQKQKKNGAQRTGSVPKGKERLEIRKGFNAPKKGKCASQDLKKGKILYILYRTHSYIKKRKEMNLMYFRKLLSFSSLAYISIIAYFICFEKTFSKFYNVFYIFV